MQVPWLHKTAIPFTLLIAPVTWLYTRSVLGVELNARIICHQPGPLLPYAFSGEKSLPGRVLPEKFFTDKRRGRPASALYISLYQGHMVGHFHLFELQADPEFQEAF
jgi:hypothetical protein